MVIHNESLFHIYFGDSADKIYPDRYLDCKQDYLLGLPQIVPIVEKLRLNNLVFLQQVHGGQGMIITNSTGIIHPFSIDGDFLITQQSGIGIGVITGDCLPVICYDKRFGVVGVAHAGWRGAVAGIVPAMLENMHENFGTLSEDLMIFFGPSAKSCCYEVGKDFKNHFDAYPEIDDTVLRRNGDSWFFDLPLFVQRQLAACGIDDCMIRTGYNNCTICDDRFCSHRRDMRTKKDSGGGRQMTIVALK